MDKGGQIQILLTALWAFFLLAPSRHRLGSQTRLANYRPLAVDC